MRLPGIDAFEHSDVVGARLDGIGDAMKQFLAFRRRHVPPGREGALCGLGGMIDVVGVAARDIGQYGVVDGRGGVKGFAGRGGDNLAIDHMADAVGLELFQKRRGALEVSLKHIGFG